MNTGPGHEPSTPQSSADEVWAIDVHGHYGDYRRHQIDPLVNEWMSAPAEEVVQRARRARIAVTVVSPLSGLMPRGEADAVAGNAEAASIVPRCEGLLQWAIVDPLRPRTFSQAHDLLREAHCVGIKIHPEEHEYPIREHGPAIFEFASREKAVILSHSGNGNSLPDDIVALANRFPEVRVILAHIGCSDSDDRTLQVRAVQKSRHGNVYADTSSAMSISSGLIEWAVHEIGAEHILFGTDTPLYAAGMQRARVDHAEIEASAKRRILRENAVALLNLSPDTLAPARS